MEEKNIIIKIKATGLELTGQIEDYARMKINLLQKFFAYYARKGDLLFEIELAKTTAHHKGGDVFRAEINFTAGGVHFRSEATKEDLFMAIDEAKDEMSRELSKLKNKHSDLFKRGGATFKKMFGLRD